MVLSSAPVRAELELDASPFLADLPVVLTASRMVQSPLDAPAPVTLIDREMIEASGFTEIQDLLRLVPGFVVADWPDGSPVVANHGLGDAHDRRIKVLIDGRTINNPLWGDTDWQDLPIRVDDIDHIEVVRGPHGGSYGANAFQGVINIITRSPLTEDGATLISRIGEDGFFDHGVRVNAPSGSPVDWRVSVSRRAAVNFKSFEGRSQEAIRRDVANVTAVTQLSTTDELRVQLGAVDGTDRRGSPGDAPDNTDPIRTERIRSQYLHVAWQRSLAVDSELTLQYYHQTHERHAKWVVKPGGGLVIPADLDADTRRDDLELQLSHRLSPSWQMLWGAAARRDGVRSKALFDTDKEITGTQWQTFASLTWKPIERLSLNAGGVLEHHHYSGAMFSPRLAANYALSALSSIRVSTGTAYRAPSFMESEGREMVRSSDGSLLKIGNYAGLSVEPEKVKYVEVGYVARFPEIGVDADARVFRERYSRYLDDQRCRASDCSFPVPEGYTGKLFPFVNSGAFTMQGSEASMSWRKPGWGRVVLSQAFIDINANGALSDRDILRSAPTALSSVLLIKELPWRSRFSLGYYHNSPMYWLNDGDRVPSRDRFDIKISRSFGPVASDNEVAVVMHSVGGDYPDFHEGNYRHEPSAFASLRLTW